MVAGLMCPARFVETKFELLLVDDETRRVPIFWFSKKGFQNRKIKNFWDYNPVTAVEAKSHMWHFCVTFLFRNPS